MSNQCRSKLMVKMCTEVNPPIAGTSNANQKAQENYNSCPQLPQITSSNNGMQ